MNQVRMMGVALAAAVCCAPATLPGQDGAQATSLEIRRIEGGGIARSGTPIATSAVKAFVYEGRPVAARVGPDHIAVEYGGSGVRFDRRTGRVAARFTVVEGWPNKRPEDSPPLVERYVGKLVGPGVFDGVYRGAPPRPGGTKAADDYDTVVSIPFGGFTWQAMQPSGFLRSLGARTGHDGRKMRELYGSWTSILRELNELCFLQAQADGSGEPIRYTMAEGLAGNIVTHLAVADGVLWAACVDIWDPDRKDWGPGGLCRFDAAARRWRRVDRIDGRPVRWVTLLQNVGGRLWAGFLEGTGVEGDTVAYGMGLYPGHYRPRATALVLACLDGGKWQTFSREPLPTDHPRRRARHAGGPPDAAPGPTGHEAPREWPTETPRRIVPLGDKILLFSQTFARAVGNWDVNMAGHLSLLDPPAESWRIFRAREDFGALELHELLAEGGQALAFTDRGAHRWLGDEGKWAFLDTGSPLVNPSLSAAAIVGRELWIGYTNQSFGVVGRQGISRYDEETGQWSYHSPEAIGTACPVRSIAPLPDGTVWVLFAHRPWLGSAAEFSFHEGQAWDAPQGVGRFADGKWQFPAKLDGVPASRQRSRNGPNGMEMWTEPLAVTQLAVAGGKLFVVNVAGLYEGPGQWKQVVAVPDGPPRWRPSLFIRPAEGGRVLEVTNLDAARDADGQERWQRGLYDPATGKLDLAPYRPSGEEEWQIQSAGYLLSFQREALWRDRWLRVPTTKAGDWAVGPLEAEYHSVVETPWAVWLASQGQLVRLDRQELKEWFGRGHD